MEIIVRGTRLRVPVRKVGFFGKILGLMFRGRGTKNLLFEFSEGSETKLHSFFVFFDFLVLWLDKNNNAVDFRVVTSWKPSISSKKTFSKIVELPLNPENRQVVRFIVGKETFK